MAVVPEVVFGAGVAGVGMFGAAVVFGAGVAGTGMFGATVVL